MNSIHCDGKWSAPYLVEVLALHSEGTRGQVGTARYHLIGDCKREGLLDGVRGIYIGLYCNLERVSSSIKGLISRLDLDIAIAENSVVEIGGVALQHWFEQFQSKGAERYGG